MWPCNTGDCFIEVTACADLTVSVKIYMALMKCHILFIIKATFPAVETT
jgi:hypothetical protein